MQNVFLKTAPHIRFNKFMYRYCKFCSGSEAALASALRMYSISAKKATYILCASNVKEATEAKVKCRKINDNKITGVNNCKLHFTFRLRVGLQLSKAN